MDILTRINICKVESKTIQTIMHKIKASQLPLSASSNFLFSLSNSTLLLTLSLASSRACVASLCFSPSKVLVASTQSDPERINSMKINTNKIKLGQKIKCTFTLVGHAPHFIIVKT